MAETSGPFQLPPLPLKPPGTFTALTLVAVTSTASPSPLPVTVPTGPVELIVTAPPSTLIDDRCRSDQRSVWRSSEEIENRANEPSRCWSS